MEADQASEAVPANRAEHICGARRKSDGKPCLKPAGWGTVHTGSGHCMHHSGSTPNGILAAARDEATVMGVAIDVEPHEALLTCVRIAAGEVAYCSQKVQELAPDEAIGRLIELKSEPTVALTDAGIAETGEMGISEIKDKGPELHVWIRIRQGALDRLARFSKMAIDAGVEERRVALAERWGEDLAGVLRTILDGLQLNAKQRERAPGVVRDALEPLEGTGNLLLG